MGKPRWACPYKPHIGPIWDVTGQPHVGMPIWTPPSPHMQTYLEGKYTINTLLLMSNTITMQTNIAFDHFFCIELSCLTTREVSMHAMFLECLPGTAVQERSPTSTL